MGTERDDLSQSASQRPSGATAAQSTVTSPSRQRPGPSSSGHVSRDLLRQRRGGAAARPTTRAVRAALPGAVEIVEEGVHRLTGDVAVDERLRQALGDVRGPLGVRASRSDTVRLIGPEWDRRSPTTRAARSRRTCHRRGCRREPVAPAPVPRLPGTSPSAYWRSTLKARTTGRSHPVVERHLEAAEPEGQAGALEGGAASRTRAGSISMPTTCTSARTRRSRSCSSTAVTGDAP